MPNFALHYLRIDWLDRATARQIEVSSEPIEIEHHSNGHYQAETQMFRNFQPWVGLRFTEPQNQTVPHLITASGAQQPWLKINDPTGDNWWIQDNGWDQERKIHLSELHRSFGQFELRLGSERLQLVNVALDIDRTQAEDYLADFPDELITLALSHRNGATGSIVRSDSTDIVDALSQFAQASALVLRNPARQLIETEELQPIGRLRPNNRTFRAMLQHPSQRVYPGRGADDTLDIPDNRFILYMVQYCARLTAQIASSSEAQARNLIARAERATTHAEALFSSESEAVDPEIFTNQLAEMEAAIAAVNSWKSVSTTDHREFNNYRIRIENPYDYLDQAYFYKRPDEDPKKDVELNIKSNIVQLPETLAPLIKEALKYLNKNARIFDFTAVAHPKRYGTQGNMRLITFDHVRGVHVHALGIEAKKQLKIRYEKNGWRRNLTRSELEERRNEAKNSQQRASQFAQRAKRSRAAATALASTSQELMAQDNQWSRLSVSASPEMPMGMRFVQSPAYAATLAAFNQVQDIASRIGIGGAEIEKVERIGILHASALYERWCLVRLISLLIDTFQFVPEANWLDRVVEGICGPITSFDLRFERTDIGMSARLEVQPVLENGRRPDFRLTFKYRSRTDSEESYGRYRAMINRKTSHGMILDAKFRTRWRQNELNDVLNDLVELREYRAANYRVFIMQPAAPALQNPTSPLLWGRDCDFGQDDPCNHSQGAIRLSPHPRDWQNLQRLIALELQSTFPQPTQNNEIWQSDSFCISCGKRHENSNVIRRRTKRGRSYWDLTCHDCSMMTRRTHCYECDTPLFKNGLALTYHRTIADQLTNVVCPSCGAFFDQDIHQNDEFRDKD